MKGFFANLGLTRGSVTESTELSFLLSRFRVPVDDDDEEDFLDDDEEEDFAVSVARCCRCVFLKASMTEVISRSCFGMDSVRSISM
jgi:hypothetical protein